MGYGALSVFRKLILGLFLAVWGQSAAAEPVTIAALGDSLTQGYGLPQEEGFVPQLQRWLQDQGADAVLINAGVSGDTTAGGAARVDWTLTPDVDAMIVTLGGNDLLRGLDPAMSRANIETILKSAEAANVPVLLIGIPAPGNFGADYKAEFDRIYPELADQYGALFLPSFFTGFGEDAGNPDAVRGFMQDDGIHPNPDGVALIVAGIGPQVLALIDRAAP